ncbi:hypothetical protein WH47_06523 [Habropoda laboriosa]|uniref:Uncharacterized protein n=1 Tax=Habropoda laboriosa TaxID=597456 RepID=A0A0L7RDA3_9HYME|nr:hypothetical protein WH47_06523 [Habropoda laboriosa]
MQSRLARRRIHQRTRAHETAVPPLPRDLNVEAEGVVYPALPLRYQLAPILSTKGNFLRYGTIRRSVFPPSYISLCLSSIPLFSALHSLISLISLIYPLPFFCISSHANLLSLPSKSRYVKDTIKLFFRQHFLRHSF